MKMIPKLMKLLKLMKLKHPLFVVVAGGAPERCPCHFEVMESRKQMLSFILDQTKQFNQFNFK